MGEIARRAGVAPSAVRFYERQGLVAAYRTSGNQRRFLPGAVCRIRVARVAQRVGLTVREIAEVLDELPEDPEGEEWTPVGRRLVEEARERIRRLESALNDIAAGSMLCTVDLRLEA
jgi:MerR family transcriptional regulator, redox-sensitive transcriptional activator SoxR